MRSRFKYRLIVSWVQVSLWSAKIGQCIIDLADQEILAIIKSAERFTHNLDITEHPKIKPSLAQFV